MIGKKVIGKKVIGKKATGKRRALICPSLMAIALALNAAAAEKKLPLAEKASKYPEIFHPASKEYLPDFSYAGYDNGNSELPEPQGKVFLVSDYGAKPNDGLDDSHAVLKAVEAAHRHKGPVIVKFPAGKFRLSEIIAIERSDFALQGEGDKTTLYYPRPMKYLPTPPHMSELAEYLVALNKRQREPKHNIDLAFSLYSWSGGFIWTRVPGARGKAYLEKYDKPPKPIGTVISGKRGDLEIELSAPAKLKVGEVFKIEWYNRDGESGSLLRELYGDRNQYPHLGSHHWNYPKRALVTQITRIKAIDGNGKRLTLSDPLLLDAKPNWQPKLVPWPHLEQVIIRDLRIEFPNGVEVAHHVEEGYNGLYLTGLYDSYVKNINFVNADSAILNDDNANVTIENITTSGDHLAHYSVHMGQVYNLLAKNLRVENRVRHPLSFNTYSVKSVYQYCELLQAPLLDQHSGANHQNLFDNITVHIQAGNKARYPLFSGGGAKYWKPSHGKFSTFYNVQVQVSGKHNTAEPFVLSGPQDGIQARLLGIYGNRRFKLEYGPSPYIEQLNQQPLAPSLYEFQQGLRRKAK